LSVLTADGAASLPPAAGSQPRNGLDFMAAWPFGPVHSVRKPFGTNVSKLFLNVFPV
jgi:hypothetical protein